MKSTPALRGHVSCHAPDLSVAQRLALAMQSTPEWRGWAAEYAPDLSADQRAALRSAV
jgi:hypothetical protein